MSGWSVLPQVLTKPLVLETGVLIQPVRLDFHSKTAFSRVQAPRSEFADGGLPTGVRK